VLHCTESHSPRAGEWLTVPLRLIGTFGEKLTLSVCQEGASRRGQPFASSCRFTEVHPAGMDLPKEKNTPTNLPRWGGKLRTLLTPLRLRLRSRVRRCNRVKINFYSNPSPGCPQIYSYDILKYLASQYVLMAHYTVAQVGEIWGFSAKHIRKLIKDGKLKAIKFGGEYRVTQEQVDEFERINTTGGNQTITTEDDSSNNE